VVHVSTMTAMWGRTSGLGASCPPVQRLRQPKVAHADLKVLVQLRMGSC
jgi:hypothetical protein